LKGEEIRLVYADLLYKHDQKKQVVVGPGLSGLRINVVETIGMDGKLKNSNYIKDIRIGGKSGDYMLIPATASPYGPSLFLLAARGAELVGTRLNE
jgi:hypothetical protein